MGNCFNANYKMVHPSKTAELNHELQVENPEKTAIQVKVRMSKRRLKELIEEANSSKDHVDIGWHIMQECFRGNDVRITSCRHFSGIAYPKSKSLEVIHEEE